MPKVTTEKKEHAGTRNLKPTSSRSADEVREIGRKGGVASGKARRERKKFRELLAIALQETNEETGKPNDVSIVAAMIQAACAGDTKAFVAIRDTLGEKPVEEKVEKVGGDIRIQWERA